MSKKNIIIDQIFLNKYQNVEIKYPFCYKTKDCRNFFRYLEDGRYEYIYDGAKKMTMSFGTRVETIAGLTDEDGFYFKVLACRETVIENYEFEEKRKEYFKNYKNYLNGDDYLAKEVEMMISLKQEQDSELESLSNLEIQSNSSFTTTEQGKVNVIENKNKLEQNTVAQNNEGIITNDDLKGDVF